MVSLESRGRPAHPLEGDVGLASSDSIPVSRLYFLGGSQIIADDNCRLEIKRHLLLGIKAMTNLDSILKSKDIKLLC